MKEKALAVLRWIREALDVALVPLLVALIVVMLIYWIPQLDITFQSPVEPDYTIQAALEDIGSHFRFGIPETDVNNEALAGRSGYIEIVEQMKELDEEWLLTEEGMVYDPYSIWYRDAQYTMVYSVTYQIPFTLPDPLPEDYVLPEHEMYDWHVTQKAEIWAQANMYIDGVERIPGAGYKDYWDIAPLGDHLFYYFSSVDQTGSIFFFPIVNQNWRQ